MADKILSIADGLHDELPSTTTAKAGRILITTDRGEMYYEPEDKKRIQVNPQADWQQNDETANDYIKNRIGGYDVLTEILPEKTLNFTDSNYLTLTDCPPIEVGKKYIVTFYNPNSYNTDYELIGREDSEGYGTIYIGNETYDWGGTDTGEPFLIYSYDEITHIYISSSETLPCTYNIKIKVITPVKIDEKYLDIKNTNIVNGSAKGSLRTVGGTEESSEYEIGSYAFAEGSGTKASGVNSHAEGEYTQASSRASHSEGYNTKALGDYSHAEGVVTKASGSCSHAEGSYTTASGYFSHAEGDSTIVSSDCSHAEGYSTIAGQIGFKVTACEKLTDTTGTYTLTSVTGLKVNQYYSVHLSSSKESCGKITAIDTINKKITVSGYPDIALSTSSSSTANYLTIDNKPNLGDIYISGIYSHAEGQFSYATGNISHAEGSYTKASGKVSHAEGHYSKASGYTSHAEGEYTTASGENSHAEGGSTTASGYASHAEGNNTTASGLSSHAEGEYTTVSGEYSHAEGEYITVSGHHSHAEGYYTTTSSNYQHVQGKLNIVDSNNIYADIIGNGDIDSETYSNAYTLDWNGNGWFSGDVYVGSTSGTNRDEGSKRLATEIYTNTVSANAIKGSVSGLNIVQITDKNNNLCPVEHDLGVKVRSKNLINYQAIENVNYAVPTLIDNGFELVGTYYAAIKNILIQPNTDYYLSYITNNIVGTTKQVSVFGDNNTSNRLALFTNGTGGTFNSGDYTSILVAFYSGDSTSGTVDFTNIQLELGTTATDYTPYVDLTTVKVSRCGKNLFDVSQVNSTTGLTNNGNGTLTVTEFAVSTTLLKTICPALKVGETYILTFTTTGVQQIYLNGANIPWYPGKSLTITEAMLNSTVFFYCKRVDGVNAEAIISDIQIQLGTTATDYEPYKECAEYTPTTDGIVNGVTSLYPNTTLTTDTDGVLIDCEYNVDLNSTIGDINTVLDSIIEIQNSLIGGN